MPGITGVDTRALVRHIRDAGAMRGGIFPAAMGEGEARERIAAEPSMVGRDLAREVTPAAPQVFEPEGPAGGPRIIALDTGIKRSIVHHFVTRGATLELHPCTTRAADLLAADPDGFFLVPGPGDPAALDYIVDTLRELVAASPCSGSASATSCSRARPASRRSSCPSATAAPTTRSRTCAPAGSRSPPRTTASRSRRRSPTSRSASTPTSASPSSPTSTSTTAPSRASGCSTCPAGCVQYHPEAGPGPHDSLGLFDEFIDRFAAHAA